MTHIYTISGMTCSNCIAKVKSELLKLADVTEATVQQTHPEATITMQRHIPLSILQNALTRAGNYTITEADGGMHTSRTEGASSWLTTYRPVLLIGAYITGISFLVEIVKVSFSMERSMQHFMAAFFLVFSFFKMLDLKGFAESYSTYDVIARKWMGWGYIYPFAELGLGLAYLVGFEPGTTNAVTFAVMSISIFGVLQSIVNKRKIQCACLGAVFNLPMSTITIIEDALMIVMSAIMLISLFIN